MEEERPGTPITVNVVIRGEGEEMLVDFPPLPLPPLQNGKRSRSLSGSSGSSSSSSSSSSSGSSSSSSSSSGSSSSSDSEEEGENSKRPVGHVNGIQTGIPNGHGPPNGIIKSPQRKKARVEIHHQFPEEVEGGKLVARGEVVNDKIRVVPDDEPVKKKKDGRGRPRKPRTPKDEKELKQKKMDPTFYACLNNKKKSVDRSQEVTPTLTLTPTMNGHATAEEKGIVPTMEDAIAMNGVQINGEQGPVNFTETPKRAPSEVSVSSTSSAGSSGRQLRNRQRRFMNEDFLFEMQHKLFVSETKDGKKAFRTPTGPKPKPSVTNRKKKDKIEFRKKDVDVSPPETYVRRSGRTADWDLYLNEKEPEYLKWIAPVTKFPNAPLADIWEDFGKIGTKVEIPNCFINASGRVYWVGTVRYFAGYKALISFEMFGYGRPRFAWISFCTDCPKPIGYCEENGIVLFPPHELVNYTEDFQLLLESVRIPYSEKSLPSNHLEIVTQKIKESQRYKLEDIVEVADLTLVHGDAHRRLLGRVTGIIGDRVHVTFIGVKETDPQDPPGFNYNVKSDYIHPLGWCQAIGFELTGVPSFARFPSFDNEYLGIPDVPPDAYFGKGMVFEVIHPVEVDKIVPAEIVRTYKFGYFLAKLKVKVESTQLQYFLFHITSPSILPCGFCARNGIRMMVPTGESEITFDWKSYCTKRQKTRLDLSFLPPRPTNPFLVGEKFEAIDLREPATCGPVTVIKVADHLVLLHFDGYDRGCSFTLQWVEWNSPQIYPAGWAEMVCHEFQSHPELPKPEDICAIISKK